MVLTMKKSLRWGGWVGGVEWSGWVGLNPILVSALAPFGLVKVGAEIGAELDNLCVFNFMIFGSTN